MSTGSVDAMLARRFEALGRFVRHVSEHVRDPGQAEIEVDALGEAGRLVERATTRLRLCAGEHGDHTVVALAGATGVGKSSLFNALATMRLSEAGPLRPTTGEAHACVWNPRGADPLLDWLRVAPHRRFVRESALDADDEASLRGLVLLDLPDVDSVATGHRIEADRLVGIVDLVIWVLDPQKYADQTVHEQYLRHMGALRDVTVVVFNQADRLSPADAGRCRADLARLVESDGLPGVPVITTSAMTGEGIGEIRTLLEKTVAGRLAAMARLEGELDATVAALRPLVAAAAVDEDRVSHEGVPELADGFAAAAGVDAVAARASRAYVRRAAVPGWPFRRGGAADGETEVPPADRAAVGVAVRRLGGRTSAGLPAPWPDEVRRAASADVDRLPDQLGRALMAAEPRRPRLVGWRIARVAWWLALATAIAGTVWFVTQLPPFEEPFVPLWMVVGGVLVAVASPRLAGRVARRRARRLGAGVEQRLREATLCVAREVVGPVRVVLRAYAQARLALQAAADGVAADRRAV